MEIIKYFSQPRWVLITASQNHSNGEPSCKIKRSERVIRGILHIKGLLKKDTNMLTRKEIKLIVLLMRIFPQSLILKRVVNDIDPRHLKSQKRPLYAICANSINKITKGNEKTAILITGSMRTTKRAKEFLYNLPSSVDVFICTDSHSYHEATHLSKNIVVDDYESKEHRAINQWQKLKTGLQFVENHEKSNNFKYTHIYKLRTDFYFIRPMHAVARMTYGSNFIAISDKIFGGERDTMMLFQNFLDFNNDISNKKIIIDNYWITNASDSVKWYGFLLERNYLKGVISVEGLKHRFKQNRLKASTGIKHELNLYRKDPDTQSRFFEGGNIFASEVVFAAFLMHQKIIPSYSKCFSGFLYSDRGN